MTPAPAPAAPATPEDISFDLPALAPAVEALPVGALDALTFGALRVDHAGVVQVYNRTERLRSGSGDRPRLGLDFFTDVAPCMATKEFRGRIERALAEGSLDLEFGWVGDFGDAERAMRVRVQSAAQGGYWIFFQRG